MLIWMLVLMHRRAQSPACVLWHCYSKLGFQPLLKSRATAEPRPTITTHVIVQVFRKEHDIWWSSKSKRHEGTNSSTSFMPWGLLIFFSFLARSLMCKAGWRKPSNSSVKIPPPGPRSETVCMFCPVGFWNHLYVTFFALIWWFSSVSKICCNFPVLQQLCIVFQVCSLLWSVSLSVSDQTTFRETMCVSSFTRQCDRESSATATTVAKLSRKKIKGRNFKDLLSNQATHPCQRRS